MSSISDRLLRPIYSYRDVDHLAGATKGTARRWLQGYSYRRKGARVTQPPVTPGTDAFQAASFVDLVEVVAIARLKHVGFSLPQIRDIVDNCIELLGVERPLATQAFKTDGREIFVPRGGNLLEVGRRKRRQAWDEVLEPFLQELDYAGDWATRWWPLGKQTPIVVDPDFGFGQSVIADSGVRTEIIIERVRAGDLPEEIASDFNVSPTEVNRAIQFETIRAS